jgi:hypothetical protein
MLRDGAALDQNALTHHLIEQYLPPPLRDLPS